MWGKHALNYQNKALRNLPCKRIQCDEIWQFCYAKSKNVPKDKKGQFGYGDVWTWVALCADTKLVPSWIIGNRDAGTACALMSDLESRLSNRVLLTTDGHRAYLEAVEGAFGSNVDYSMLIKLFAMAMTGRMKHATVQRNVLEPASCRLSVTRTRSISPRASWSARISRCEWECVVLQG